MTVNNLFLKFTGLFVSLLLISSDLSLKKIAVAQVLPTWDGYSYPQKPPRVRTRPTPQTSSTSPPPETPQTPQPTPSPSPQLNQEEIANTGEGKCQLELRRISLQYDRQIINHYQNSPEIIKRYQINQPEDCQALYIYRRKVFVSIE